MKHFNICKTALLLVLMLTSAARLLAQEAYAELSPDGTTLTFYFDNEENQKEGATFSLPSAGVPGWNYYSSILKKITKVVFDESFADARPTTTNSWFAKMNNLTEIVGMEHLNTSEVTSMRSMFQGCYSLGTVTAEDPYDESDPLDLSHFDTSKVTDMNSMFDVANRAMGRAYFQEENYDEALRYARLAKDRDGYSDAYWEVRNVWLKRNIATVFIVGIAAFALFTCGVMSANGATCARRWRFSSSCSRYSSSASWH